MGMQANAVMSRRAPPAAATVRQTWAAACLAPALALLLAAGPARAQGADGDERSSMGQVFADHGWRFVPLSQMLEQSQRQYLGTRGMPRLLPLAMMPMKQSALWIGFSSPRGNVPGQAQVQLELRWSIPLDRIGGAIEVPSLALR
jgi:transposase InsO family protein